MEKYLSLTAIMIYFAVYVLSMLPYFNLARRAGEKKAYYAFIPVLNMIMLLRLVGKPIWTIILFFIPGIGGIMYLYHFVLLLRQFRRGTIALVLSCICAIIASVSISSVLNPIFLTIGYLILVGFSFSDYESFGLYVGKDRMTEGY